MLHTHYSFKSTKVQIAETLNLLQLTDFKWVCTWQIWGIVNFSVLRLLLLATEM